MIIGKLHPGSGLGDQLFSYIITRVIALDRGFDYGFVGKEFFKGKDFMNLDWGIATGEKYHIEPQSGKLIFDQPLNEKLVYEINKPYYDPEVNFIQDGTIIDGYGAQDERYFEHRLDEIREWLKVEPLELPKNLLVINFRGGEYKAIPELFLPWGYWDKAMNIIGKDRPIEIHTDNENDAKYMFGGMFDYWQGIELNWRSLRYAKNAIISNSAFAIIPRLLKHLEDPEAVTIAPRYWAGRNVGEWRRPQNFYKKFQYI